MLSSTPSTMTATAPGLGDELLAVRGARGRPVLPGEVSMVETLLAATAFTAGLACGLRLRYRQRAVLDALLVEATDSVN